MQITLSDFYCAMLLEGRVSAFTTLLRVEIRSSGGSTVGIGVSKDANADVAKSFTTPSDLPMSRKGLSYISHSQ